MKSGKNDMAVRPDGEIIKLVDKNEHYKYFCIIEADCITRRNKI